MTRVRARAAFFICLFTLLPSAARGQAVRYDGHRVARVEVCNQAELDRLLQLTDDVWSENIGIGPLDVRVSPAQFARLERSGLHFEVWMEDVQAVIDEQSFFPYGAGPFDDYMPNAEVEAYLAGLVALRPDLAQSIVLGQTLENRNIVGLRITGPGGGTKPGVLYHGCEHAREWITVPVALWVADRLVRDYDTDPYIHELVNRIEWFIVPVFNVDGYVYTWGPDRLWRKNRRNNGNGTFGVDINRNWGYGWGGEGASSDPGSETYRGTAPFSEPETQVMRDFFLAHPNIVAHNDLHCYSQLILWPWGYTPTLNPDNDEFAFVGQTMSQLIQAVHGSFYDPGPIYTNIYPASGVSVDWVYGTFGSLSFSFELRDTGQYGFLLPPDQIIPNCEEAFPALIFLADWASAALRIEFPNGLPTLIAPGVPTMLDVRILPANQAVDPNGATLHVRTSAAGPFAEYPLVHVSGNDFLATFPPRDCGAPTEFYISAQGDQGGVVYSPAGAPGALYSVPVGSATTALSDNFESDLGWSVQNVDLQAGAWVRVDPLGTTQNGQPAQPNDDNPAGTGTLCYVTGQGTPGGSVGEADVDGGPTRLISPALALAGEADPVISYYRWHYASGNDLFTVEVSNNDGASWVVVETVGNANAWQQRSFRVLDFVSPLTNSVRVRFSAVDNPNNGIVEAAIDDFAVSSITCESVPVTGDLNCDGAVNTLDIPAMVLALLDPAEYGTTYPACDISRGDFDGGGSVDGDDVGPFVALVIP